MSYETLHKKKWSFSFKIFSVNVTEADDLVTYTEEILNGKLHFLSSEMNMVVEACVTLNDSVLSETMF